jgi:hypothetical protein
LKRSALAHAPLQIKSREKKVAAAATGREQVKEEEVSSVNKGCKVQNATADCCIFALVRQIRFRYRWQQLPADEF